MAATAETAYLAEQSILRFLSVHPVVFYWTFTFHDNVIDKAEAERRFRPLVDLLRRRGIAWLVFWEPQKRGAWHVHILIDKFIDVNWLRPWLVERGWGPIMKVKIVEKGARWVPGRGWVTDDRSVRRLCWYLRKYLTKSLTASSDGKKAFGAGGGKRWKSAEEPGRPSPRVGNTRFKWNPWTGNPLAYLYQAGRELYWELYGEAPNLRKDGVFNRGAWLAVVRLGVEATDWMSYDPWFYLSG